MTHRVPTSIRGMDKAEIAWVAGLLEGEGSFSSAQHHGRGHQIGRVDMQSIDHDTLETLARITGIGSVHGPLAPQPNRQPLWYWRVQRHNDVRALTELIYPWMGARRRRQIEAIWEGQDKERLNPRPRKVSPEDAEAIRSSYSAGGFTQQTLALMYGITQSTVSSILHRRRRWAER